MDNAFHTFVRLLHVPNITRYCTTTRYASTFSLLNVAHHFYPKILYDLVVLLYAKERDGIGTELLYHTARLSRRVFILKYRSVANCTI